MKDEKEVIEMYNTLKKIRDDQFNCGEFNNVVYTMVSCLEWVLGFERKN